MIAGRAPAARALLAPALGPARRATRRASFATACSRRRSRSTDGLEQVRAWQRAGRRRLRPRPRARRASSSALRPRRSTTTTRSSCARFADDPLLGETIRAAARAAAAAHGDRRARAAARRRRTADHRARARARSSARSSARRRRQLGGLHARADRRRPRALLARRAAPTSASARGAARRSSGSAASLDLEALKGLPTDAVARRLERERGLGPWSVGVVCLEGLGRYERGLARDLGLVKLAAALWGRRVEAEETDVLLEPYGEWAGLASVYLLAGYHAGLVGLRRCGSRSSAPARSASRSSPGCVAPTGPTSSRPRGARSASTELRERHGVEATTSNAEAIKGADVVVLAVKPQDIETLLGEIGHLLTAGADRALGRRGDPDRERSSATSPPTSRSCARCRTRRRPSTRASPACAPGATRAASTSTAPAPSCAPSATSSRCPRTRWTRSPPSPARGPPTTRCSPRR